MRLALSLLLILHGLIHLLGFIKEFHLAALPQLSVKAFLQASPAIAKGVGALWLLTCLLFQGSAALILLQKTSWWMLAAPAVIFSQALIIIYWSDAKFGTIANLLVLITLVQGYGRWNVTNMVEDEIRDLHLSLPTSQSEVKPKQIEALPPIVQKWLQRAQVTGKEMIVYAHLLQQGQMRTKPDGAWMLVQSEQFFTVQQPGFLWIANVQAAPGIYLAGRDKLSNGHGHMLIKLLSLVPIANETGKEIDQGTLLRYLAESIWFPTSALNPYLSWQQLDSHHARASLTQGSQTVSGVFEFNDAGDVIAFESLRYYDRPTGATLEPWKITIAENSYKIFGGYRIPTKASVTWKLKTGDFTWYNLEIKDANFNYNIPQLP